MTSVRFFATKNDLAPVLDRLESNRPIKYVSFDVSRSAEPKMFFSWQALPKLGTATEDSAINCSSFLICVREYAIHARQVGGGGEPRYTVDQLENPDSVVFNPGGLRGKDVLLHGSFGSASTSQIAAELMKVAGSAVRKEWNKVKAFYVGAEAEKILRKGGRLTISVQSPRDFDLRA